MKILFLLSLITGGLAAAASPEITPFKYVDTPAPYEIPASSRFTAKRDADAPDIVYYLSKPNVTSYPIAIVCTGSTSKDSITSVIHIHRYFLQEFLDLGAGVLTVEQWGIDGERVDEKEFMHHYTYTQRLNDHKNVIEHLRSNPPPGWNGNFIFLGASEGGPLVTTLTTLYQDCTIATINWSGAGAWNWREELWAFIQAEPQLKAENSSREIYDAHMNETLRNPTPNEDYMGMTYKYHADALTYPDYEYSKIHTPFLVVSGAFDSIIDSSDQFVEKALAAGANITYFRIGDMDHYVRKRPEIVEKSFEWLKKQLN